MWIELTVLALCMAAVAAVLLHTVLLGSPPMPTLPATGRALMGILPAEVDGSIVEMGSGWGSLAIALARRYPGQRVLGYELSPLPWFVSRAAARLLRVRNLQLLRRDLWSANLDGVGLVVCYLNPEIMRGLDDKLRADLAPGAYVASNTFALRGWDPVATAWARDLYRSPVYLYRLEIPAVTP